MQPKRTYRGEHRARQAKLQTQATAARILAAARRTFVDAGYLGTTIRAIADAAGVAEPTVYAHFGSKRAILEALVDEVKAASAAPELEATYERAADTEERLAAGFAVLRRHFEAAADVDRVIRDAERQGENLGLDTGVGDDGRRAHARRVVSRLRRDGRLRPGVPAREAADVLFLLSSLETYDALVVASGWTPAAYERWLVGAASRLLTKEET